MYRTRRRFLSGIGLTGTGLALHACSVVEEMQSDKADEAVEAGNQEGKEVTAVEDLMREHGVLRRALLVYSETAARMRDNPGSVSPDALQKTAMLFRAFGEDYHERKLEEAYIFPAVLRVGGAAAYPDVLVAQHQRGREITDYILAVTAGAKLGKAEAEELARALEGLVLMYRNHAAREDTIVFPAWKQSLTAQQLEEMGDNFEDIEREQFGADGFEDAVRRIQDIETSLGLNELAQFTAPPAPARQPQE
jgi:hemerythrin-like domain-containing protein